MNDFETAREFAQFIKGLGFRAFVAGVPGGEGMRGYGFITDAEGTRVLGFGMQDGTLSGNYNGDRQTGSGWRMDSSIWSLKSAEDVKRALYATAPSWTGFNARAANRCPTCGQSTGEPRAAQTYRTLEQYLSLYGSSSKFQEI